MFYQIWYGGYKYNKTDGINSVRTFDKNNLHTFKYAQGRSNHVIVIDTLARAYVIEPTAFAKIPSSARSYHFKLTGSGKEVASVDDVQKMLNGIDGSMSSL